MLGRPSPSPYASSPAGPPTARSGSGSGSGSATGRPGPGALGAGRVPESPFYRRPSAMAPLQGRKSSMPTTLPSAPELIGRDHPLNPSSSSSSLQFASSQYQSQARTSTTPKPAAAAAAAGAGFLARPSVPLSNASTTNLHSQTTPSRLLLARSSSASLANGNTLAMSASVPDLRSVVSGPHAQSRTGLHMLLPVPEVRRASTTAVTAPAAAAATPETPTPLSRRASAARTDTPQGGCAMPSRGNDRTPRPSDRFRSSILGSRQQQPPLHPALASSSSNGPAPPPTPFGQRTAAHPPLRMSLSMASLPSQSSYSTPGNATPTNNGYSHSMNAARESVSRYLDAAADLAQDSATGFVSELSVESMRDENLELKLKLMHYERNMPRDHLDLVNQNIVLTKRVLELQRDLALANQRSPSHSRTTTTTTTTAELNPHARTRTSTASTLTASSSADSDSHSGSASASTSTSTSPTSMIRVSADPPLSSAFASARRSMTAIGPLSDHHHDSTAQEATPRRDAPRGQVPATPPAVRSQDVFTTPPTVTAQNVRGAGGMDARTRMSLVHDPEQIDEEGNEDEHVSPRSPLLHRSKMAHGHAAQRPPSYLSHHRASIDSQVSTTSAAAAATCPLPPSSPMSPTPTHSHARRDTKNSAHSTASACSSVASHRGLYRRSRTRSPSPHSSASASASTTTDADTSMADLDRAVRNLSMTESIHLTKPLAGMAHVPDSPEPNRILSPPLTSASLVTPRPQPIGESEAPPTVRPLRTRLFADHPSVAAAATTAGRRPSFTDPSGPSFLRSPTLAPLTSPSSTSLAFVPASPAVSTHTNLSEHEEIQVLTQTAADRILGLGLGAATPTRRSSASTGGTVMPAALATPLGRPSRRPSEATSTGTLSPPLASPGRDAVESAPQAVSGQVPHVRPAAADESILSDNTLFMFSGEESDATTLDQMALADDEDRVIKVVAPPAPAPARAAARRRSVSGPMVVGRAKAMAAMGRAVEASGREREQVAASGIEDQSWVFAEEDGNDGDV